MTLPPLLAAALDGMLDGVSRKALAERAARLSDRYRAGGGSETIAAEADALAYACARMPATGAALAAVFAAVSEALPDFAPQSLLDAGAGPGTASWMALGSWPGLDRITMLDRNPALRALARRLADQGPSALARADILAGDLEQAEGSRADLPHADMVVASYVLAELPEDRAATLALGLWRAADAVLVLAEPGTPQGFARIRAARAALIADGAHVAAPCTHDAACPLGRSEGISRSDKENKADDWCHFSQRLPRSRDHMRMKGGTVPFEDERYCYLAVTRIPAAHHAARILAPPLEVKPGLTFKLCDSSGLRAQFVPARDRDATRRARRLGWGDLF